MEGVKSTNPMRDRRW